jgi:hypothetical protein
MPQQTKPAQKQSNNQTERILNNYNIVEEKDQKTLMDEDIQKTKDNYIKTSHGNYITTPIKNEMTLDEAYAYLEVNKDAQNNDDYSKQVDLSNLEHIKQRIKKAEAKYFAFLNKEFNVLNRKMLKCCVYCYDNPEVRFAVMY